MRRVSRARSLGGPSRVDSVCLCCSANRGSGVVCTLHRLCLHLHLELTSPSPLLVLVLSLTLPATPVPVPHAGTINDTTVWAVSGGKERKKRNRGLAVVDDEIDALFECSLRRKVVPSAFVVEVSGAALDSESISLRIPSTTTTQEKLVIKMLTAVLVRSLTRSGWHRRSMKGIKGVCHDQDKEVGMGWCLLLTQFACALIFFFVLKWSKSRRVSQSSYSKRTIFAEDSR